jgi:NACHT conflict system protein/NACHT domain-containing protein
MAAIESAAVLLGTVIAKSACSIWLNLPDGSADYPIDAFARKLDSLVDRRRLGRIVDKAAESVAERIQPLVQAEFAELPENERIAAVDAVRGTFALGRLTERDLYARDLDAGYLDRHLRAAAPDVSTRAGLSIDGSALYDLLLRECCIYAIEIARNLPAAGIGALTEVLRRETQILAGLDHILDRLPVRHGTADFERAYRQLVRIDLDRLELFGATLSAVVRRYSLSISYLSLNVSTDLAARRGQLPGARPATPSSGALVARVDDVLALSRRLFIRGPAGLGKTTLLQWIGVQSATRAFPAQMADWNDTVPFFISLRRYVGRELPAPQAFLSGLGRHIADEMPAGWLHDQLRSGRALVLIDGVDEIPERDRRAAQRWLSELVGTFPAARYVVTSRPGAVPANWLGADDFDVAELEPMTIADIRTFVHRWHDAVRDQCATEAERVELDQYEDRFGRSLNAHRHLRQLAAYPLLCALLCALHRDRRAHLPGSRMELYEVALHMLLERRDRERGIEPDALTRTDKVLLLQDLASWFIRNGWSDAPIDRVVEHLEAKLRWMPQIRLDAASTYAALLERSGLIREPVAGRVDFVHRTFQEYLAAKDAVDGDLVGELIRHAHLDQWQGVVVMAAGHAPTGRRSELIRGLLRRAETEPSRTRTETLRLLALACLATSPELPTELRTQVTDVAGTLIPPRNLSLARALARSAPFTVDMLAAAKPVTPQETAATIRALAETGDPAVLPALARFGTDPRKPVVQELIRAWSLFDVQEYARTVLPEYPVRDDWFRVDDLNLLPALHHLRRLRKLMVKAPQDGVVPLGFVRDLPELTELHINVADELTPLSDSQLETLVVWSPQVDSAVSLDPLANLDTLTWICVDRAVGDFAGLSRLPLLDGLVLDRLHTVAAAEQFAAFPRLKTAIVGRVSDLADLGPLAALVAPSFVGARWCPDLRDLSLLSRWRDTVTGVNFGDSPHVSLEPLAGLDRLEAAYLHGHGPDQDLSPLARLPRLGAVALGNETGVPDLTPLRNCAALTELWFVRTPTVDLSPLAGMPSLTVLAGRLTKIHGVDALGAGSRIRRAD